MYTVYQFLFQSEGVTEMFLDKIKDYPEIINHFSLPITKEDSLHPKSIVCIVVNGNMLTNDLDYNLHNLIFKDALEYDGIPFGLFSCQANSLINYEDEFVKKIGSKNN